MEKEGKIFLWNFRRIFFQLKMKIADYNVLKSKKDSLTAIEEQYLLANSIWSTDKNNLFQSESERYKKTTRNRLKSALCHSTVMLVIMGSWILFTITAFQAH